MRRQAWIAPLVGVSLAVATFALHERMGIPRRIDLGEPFVPRPEVARLSSVGFQTALADYYWLQAVQIVGASLHPEDQGTILGRFIDVVTTLDPWVGHPYRFAAVWMTGSEDDVRHANAILRRSLQPHPHEWRNRFYLGFNHFYYLDEPERAAEWLEQAARLEGSPDYLMGLAARLRAQREGLDVAAGMIRQMWQGTTDPYARARYERMLEEIQTERLARELDEARRRYRERFGRDIERVADLLRGPKPVLRRLPREPHGFEWVLDEKSGEIVSSWYGSRYRPHGDPTLRTSRERWRPRGAQEEGETS